MKSSHFKYATNALFPYPCKTELLHPIHSTNTTTFMYMLKKNPPRSTPGPISTKIIKKKDDVIKIRKTQSFCQEESSSLNLLDLFNQDQKKMY